MKIIVEIDENLHEEEIVIRCSGISDRIQRIQKAILENASSGLNISFFKDNVEYYLSLDDILFFETEENGVSAHTVSNAFQVRYRLYELEEILPRYFYRVSKSTILNVNHIFSISRNLASTNVVQFNNTHKQVFVSRHYYKPLKSGIDERRRK